MNGFTLNLFPHGSLSESVITTVWLGAMVVIFFNSRFGWSLSGIINPGYLAPLLILKPISVGVILIEGCVAYLLAKLLFVAPAKAGLWQRVFGRDRFFALILISIGVRLGFDGFLLPRLADWLGTFGVPFSWRSQFHGFGLIIIALIANQFWKPGITRGLPQLLVSLVLTWLLTVFVLMQFTNFTISNVAYLYEDLAGSISGTPKAYIILLIAGYLASRMNLNFGWEYNGILVPSLLALLWHQPQAILMTLVEAFVIFFLAKAILKLPFMGNIRIEGGTKLLFFFSVGFGYKMVLAYGLAFFAPQTPVTDYFGFGYMLSTLMAMKMVQKEIPVFLARSVVQVSLLAAVIGNLVGYGLTFWRSSQPISEQQVTRVAQEDTVLEFLRSASFPTQEAKGSDTIRGIQATMRLLMADPKTEASQLPLPEGYTVRVLEDRFIGLRPLQGRAGSVYIFDPSAGNDFSVLAPFPISEALTLEAVWSLARQLDAAWAVFGPGLPPRKGEAMSVRAGVEDRLRIAGAPPQNLDLRALNHLVSGLDWLWSGQDPELHADAQLTLAKTTRQRLLMGLQNGASSPGSARVVEHEGHPARWLMDRLAEALPEGSGTYHPPSRSQRRFFDAEVLRPLLRIVASSPAEEADADALVLIASAASTLRYRLHRFRHGQDTYLALAERGGKKYRGRGTVIFRLGVSQPLQVQVPRPLSEPGTAPFGFALFDELEARSLLLAGAHTRVRQDGTKPTGPDSLISLFSQAEMRTLGDRPFTALQIRGTRMEDEVQREVVIAATANFPGTLTEHLAAFLVAKDTRPVWAKGQDETAGYEVHGLPLAGYLDQTAGKAMAGLWLGPKTRERYRQRSDARYWQRRFEALGIATIHRNLTTWTPQGQPGSPTQSLTRQVALFQASGDVMVVAALMADGFLLTHVRDRATRQSYLLVRDPEKKPVLLANLEADGKGPTGSVASEPLQNLVNRRIGLMTWGVAP